MGGVKIANGQFLIVKYLVILPLFLFMRRYSKIGRFRRTGSMFDRLVSPEIVYWRQMRVSLI